MSVSYPRSFPLVSACLALAAAGCPGPSRGAPDVRTAGGTVLVYEAPAGRPAGELADGLRRRLDPSDLGRVTVRPVGESRIEVAVLRVAGEETEAEAVRQVKELVAADPPGLRLVEETKVEPE